jgi:hypothetical protein
MSPRSCAMKWLTCVYHSDASSWISTTGSSRGYECGSGSAGRYRSRLSDTMILEENHILAEGQRTAVARYNLLCRVYL